MGQSRKATKSEPIDIRAKSKRRCLRCFAVSEHSIEDVHDVDILPERASIPYRTRLCRKCREDVEIVVDRGPVNE